MNRRKIMVTVRACVLVLLATLCVSAVAEGYGIAEYNSSKISALLNSVKSTSKTKNSAANTAGQQKANQPAPPKDGVSEEAFATMSHQMMPLTPEQIKTLHYLFDQTQKATADYPGIPPKPTSTSLVVNLSPGASPPIVRLQRGYVTSLVFVDATGAPWPIQMYDIGDQKSFNVQWNNKGNTLMVQALTQYTSGNLAVVLKGLNTPIMITLMPGQHAVDYRVDLRVPSLGPNANPALSGLPAVESPALMNVLDGIPPHGAQALIVEGAGQSCQAWLVNGKVYLRTRMSILSPAFISTMSSPDGTHAYEIQATPIVLALSRGQTIKLTIKGL
jgi:intracellular multiplication protein IcmK